MGIKKIFEKTFEDTDQPLPEVSAGYSFFKGAKLKVNIIYPDQSKKEYYIKIKDAYTITIDKKKYLFIPNTVLKGKKRCEVSYYFNNPSPILSKYESSKFKAVDMYSDTEKENMIKNDKSLHNTISKTVIDSEALHATMTSNLINKMFSENNMLTTKNVAILAGIALIALIAILQATGRIDIMSFFIAKGG